MEILSPGEKIKKIRKELKIRQQDITGGEITRELISIIENDKSKLTPAVAQIITDNINKICKLRNINFTLEVSSLLEDVNTQAKKLADQYIDYLNKIENNVPEDFSEDINKIETFLLNYNIQEKKAIIYEKIGNILKNQKEYGKCSIYYIKAFENHDKLYNDIRIIKLLQKIGNIFIILARYKEALDFNNLALIYDDHIPDDLKYKLFFNNILAHIYLKEYSAALNEISLIETTFKNLARQDHFEIGVLKVNCLRWQKFYTDAFHLNEYLLSTLEPSEMENRILITGNILDIYTILKDTKNIKLYLEKLMNLINHFENIDASYHAPNVYRQIGISANLIGELSTAKEHYKKSIKVCKQHRNIDILEKSLDEYLNILIECKEELEINQFKNELLELVSLDIIKRNNIEILKLINYYNSINDRESIENLLDFVLGDTK